jgi:23S rRNA pseudouridine1911/1915/1917 synthase
MENPEEQIETVRVDAEAAGQRLDKLLATSLPEISRSRLKALIESGQVTMVRGGAKAAVTEAAFKVKQDDEIRVEIPAPVAALPEGQDIPLTIVYEDEHLIIIDKPAGMVVHPAAGNLDGTLVNALIAHCGESLSGIGGVKRPGIVHRIDKDTSGLLVVAKSDAAHTGLSAQFAAHNLERVYKALVWGNPTPPVGRIEGNIGRSSANRKKMAIVKSGGKHAVTHYRVLKRFGPEKAPYASLIECRLETGRTHQIRVHMTELGHPLVGDQTYGSQARRSRHLPDEAKAALQNFTRQALHASVIGFEHPVTHQFLKFESQIPPDIEQLVHLLE